MSEFEFEAQYDPKKQSADDISLSIEDLRGLFLQLREDLDRIQFPQEGNLLRLRNPLANLVKGDLVAFDGSKTSTALVRIPIGSPNMVLTVSPAQNSGIAWTAQSSNFMGLANAIQIFLPRP